MAMDDEPTGNSQVTAGRGRGIGRPFALGDRANPNGRPRKGHALSEILRARPLKDKRELVEVAYTQARKGDVAWAEWIAKHSGESGMREAGLTVVMAPTTVYVDGPRPQLRLDE